jgi:hypothetical protein
MNWLRRLACRLGMHKWKQMAGEGSDLHVMCRICGKQTTLEVW